jgi:sulfopyruvate decarboxylase subunit alpha
MSNAFRDARGLLPGGDNSASLCRRRQRRQQVFLSTTQPAADKFALGRRGLAVASANGLGSGLFADGRGGRHFLNNLPAEGADTHRPSEVLNTLKRLGFGAVVSVPDGWLGEMLVRIEREPTMRLVRATHEEEALAIACGIRLGGVRTALLVQNAGVLSMGAGMVSLAQRYQFPLLMLVSYRGTPEDPVFYHVPKGRVTEPVFRGIGLGYICVDRHRRIGPQVEQAATYAEEASCPFALLLSREDIQW